MEKKDRANKRLQDKHHKKPPPPKSTAKAQKNSPAPVAPQSAPLIVYDDPFSRRPIEPNRNRDIPSDGSDSEDEQLHAADLEKLLQMPPSASGHFILSTERHWSDESAEPSIVSGKTSQQYGQYFQIDTRQLNVCLSTIPLYERNGYSEQLFNKREIDCMKLRASKELEKYEELRSKHESVNAPKMSNFPVAPPTKCLIGPDALPPPVQRATVAPPVPCLVGPMALPPELRNDPNVTGSVKAVPVVDDVVPIDDDVQQQPTTEGSSKERKDQSNEARKEGGAAKTETKEEIQQWLDDILDM